MSVESFIRKFGQVTESYFFYGGEVELRYAPKEHVYYLVTGEELEVQDGVTTVVHIIDKSEALIPWACKMMAAKLLAEAPYAIDEASGTKTLILSGADFEKFVLDAKTAHKDKLEDAGEVGHTAHAWIENYIKSVIAGDEPRRMELLAKFPEDERASNCCMAALDWMRAHNVRWISTERKIYSRRFKYAGTMDGLCKVDSCSDPACCPHHFVDRLTIADWKTSNYLYPEYLLQTAAYAKAFNEETIDTWNHGDPEMLLATDRWVIRLGKDDGEFDPWHADASTLEQDWEGFHLALLLGRAFKGIKARVKAKEDQEKAEVKAAKKAAREAKVLADAEQKAIERTERLRLREEALKLKCPKADKYKGMKPPKCNDGEPCVHCLTTYNTRHAAKLAAQPEGDVPCPLIQQKPGDCLSPSPSSS